MRVRDKVVVITGGARGIGKATAKKFLEEGAAVVFCDRDAEAGRETLEELRSLGSVAFYPVDVTAEEDIRDFIGKVVEAHHRVDVLINNAGITMDGLLTKLAEEAWHKVLAVNLTGVFLCTKAVVPFMIERGRGVILNASSVVGLYGNFGQTNYAATKAGVIGLTRTWAKELGPKGIRVNAVAPGFIATDMTAKVPEKILERMREQTPLKTLGRPEDIASAYLFLASDEARYINGAVLSVDGGLVL
ncbi:MAG TPA: 3-oxoacyl-[acyl-carrier-protein] reductase [Alicyclobacillus sp.]|nr:3-oxoacyl-[acyl-carrier-protein] reductase [Alicyclobacillus sp.]